MYTADNRLHPYSSQMGVCSSGTRVDFSHLLHALRVVRVVRVQHSKTRQIAWLGVGKLHGLHQYNGGAAQCICLLEIAKVQG